MAVWGGGNTAIGWPSLLRTSKFAPEKKRRFLNERSKKRKQASRIVSKLFPAFCVFFFKYRKNSLMSFFFGFGRSEGPRQCQPTTNPPAENSSTPRNWLGSSAWRCRIRTRKSRRGNRRPRAGDGCCGNDGHFRKKKVEKDTLLMLMVQKSGENHLR